MDILYNPTLHVICGVQWYIAAPGNISVEFSVRPIFAKRNLSDLYKRNLFDLQCKNTFKLINYVLRNILKI